MPKIKLFLQKNAKTVMTLARTYSKNAKFFCKRNLRQLEVSPSDPKNSPPPLLRISGNAPDWRAQAKLLDVFSNDIKRKAKKRS